jgi:L,D-transpeptidase YcbB
MQDDIKQFIGGPRLIGSQLSSAARVRKFYELRGFMPAWQDNREATAQLLGLLSSSARLGLDSTDYYFPSIAAFYNDKTPKLTRDDSLLVEIRLTDAALHFFNDLANGNQHPAFGYDGLGYAPACYDIAAALNTAVDQQIVGLLADVVQPVSRDYLALKVRMNQLQEACAAPSFKDEVVTSSEVSAANRQLLKRLWQLRILDSIPTHITADALKAVVKQAQRAFSLAPDGALRSTVLKELNVPLKIRIEELKLALNTLRWLHCAKANGPVIVVNIPSANLLVYENNRVILESKIIVGKKSTRTPALTSKVTEVVLYPYWMVPRGIATKELLPLIRRDVGYLDRNGLQVLNEQGRVMNPRSINWKELSTAYFPYVLRQSTGCDNSLGLVKLNFYNPYNVYLHDTPWKVLFAANKRYFSHGCMRVEKAMEMAHLLLKGNTIAVDTLEDKGCLRNQAPVVVRASVQMPVFVLYNTAWIDSAAVVTFNEDVYGRLPFSKKPR